MSNEKYKSISQRFFKSFETNDQAALQEVLSPSLKAHHAGLAKPVDRETLLQIIGSYHEAFSEQKYTIEDQIVEGDKVATRVTWRAIHTGEFQGLPPTGKKVAITGTAISQFKDGQIVERWLDMDTMGLMQQLGLVPPPG